MADLVWVDAGDYALAVVVFKDQAVVAHGVHVGFVEVYEPYVVYAAQLHVSRERAAGGSAAENCYLHILHFLSKR